MLRLISRIRERDGILGFAQLVGIKYNQTIIGEVFAQLRRELLEGAVAFSLLALAKENRPAAFAASPFSLLYYVSQELIWYTCS